MNRPHFLIGFLLGALIVYLLLDRRPDDTPPRKPAKVLKPDFTYDDDGNLAVG